MISAAFFCAHFGGEMELKRLSNKFYSVYNKKDYPNILRKINRSYSVYRVEIEGDKLVHTCKDKY